MSHYSQDENILRMEDNVDNDEYAEIFKHELGHFIDAQLGRISTSENFGYAIQADKYWLDLSREEGIGNINRMIEELSDLPAVMDCRYVSDIFSGVLMGGDSKIRKLYYSMDYAYYGHEYEYWTGDKGPEKAVEKEAFADLFAIYAENNSTTVKFVERWFPNTAKRFKTEIGERANEK